MAAMARSNKALPVRNNPTTYHTRRVKHWQAPSKEARTAEEDTSLKSDAQTTAAEADRQRIVRAVIAAIDAPKAQQKQHNATQHRVKAGKWWQE